MSTRLFGRIRLAHASMLSFAMVASLLLATACDGASDRHTSLYELPAGYKGWVLIRYGDPACPKLPINGTYRVVSVPASGRVCTADTLQEGWQVVPRFEYVYPDGARTQLALGRPGRDGQIWMWGVNDLGEESFFVGTEDELAQEGSANPAQHRSITP